MKFYSIFFLCLLSACAENPGKVLYEGLMGKSIYYADEKFGSPNKLEHYTNDPTAGIIYFADERFGPALRVVNYTIDPKDGPIRFAEWSASGTKRITNPTTQQTFGQVGGQSFNATTYGSTTQIVPAKCIVRIYYPRKTKIIGHVEASGNACEFYANKLD